MSKVKEITHELACSTKFAKLDDTNCYFCIILNEESSYLSIFSSSFRHFHFLCLPFVLICSQDIFQWLMDQILENCKGVIGIANDIIIHRHDDKEHINVCTHSCRSPENMGLFSLVMNVP